MRGLVRHKEERKTQYLFSSSGKWIAFRQGKHVYDTRGTWIGWLPWEDGYVVSDRGKYLDNREAR